jgi:hypothetical protein
LKTPCPNQAIRTGPARSRATIVTVRLTFEGPVLTFE